jgi:hypothetical protein
MDLRKWVSISVVLLGGAAFADGKPGPDAAKATARSWMGALRDKTTDRLAKVTLFPFSVDGIAPLSGKDAKRCASQSAKDAKGLDGAAKCMYGSKDFMDDLPADFALAKWKVIEAKDIPKAFDKKKDKLAALAADHALVQLELTGDDLNYTLILVVGQVGGNNGVQMVVADGKKPAE